MEAIVFIILQIFFATHAILKIGEYSRIVNTFVLGQKNRANCWDCNGFYIGKTKRRLHDRKTEHFKALAKNDNTSAIADHVKATGHNIKWDHFDILAKGKTDYHCKIKETLYIQELEPAFNVNVGSEKLMLY